MGAASEPRPLDGVDVRGVAEGLDDGDRDTSWWYDPSTGQAEPGVAGWIADEFGDDDDPEDRGLVPIESHGSRAAYADMVTFASAVADRRPPTSCNERSRAAAPSAGSATRCTSSRTSSDRGATTRRRERSCERSTGS